MRTYAIGDIHGQLDMLKNAHALIAADRRQTGDTEAPVVHLGDLIDRGPDSKGVIQYLIDGLADHQPWLVIKGNHDRYLERFLADARVTDRQITSGLQWFNPRLGGDATMASYGVNAVDYADIEPIFTAAKAAVPQAHLDFITALPLYIERGPILYVHAGIRPGIAMEHQDEEDLLWIRDGFLEDRRDHGPLIVHGHTALDAPMHFGNRVDLDSGAGYGRPITAAVFEDRDVSVLTADGRVPLVPS